MRYTFSVTAHPKCHSDVLHIHADGKCIFSIPFEYDVGMKQIVTMCKEGFANIEKDERAVISEIWFPDYGVRFDFTFNETAFTISFEEFKICLSLGDCDTHSLAVCLEQLEANYAARKEQWRLRHSEPSIFAQEQP